MCSNDYQRLHQVSVVTERTLTQNAALHLYFRQLAEALNDAGFDMKKTLKEEIEIPWTEDAIKTHLWKPVQVAMVKDASTTKLSTIGLPEVYEVLNRHLASKFGVSVPFPHRDDYGS